MKKPEHPRRSVRKMMNMLSTTHARMAVWKLKTWSRQRRDDWKFARSTLRVPIFCVGQVRGCLISVCGAPSPTAWRGKNTTEKRDWTNKRLASVCVCACVRACECVRMCARACVRACVCARAHVCVRAWARAQARLCHNEKRVPDKWQARQAIPATLQVSSSKHNTNKYNKNTLSLSFPFLTKLHVW